MKSLKPYIATTGVSRAMDSEQDLYNELCCYTLNHAGALFVHQHVVDAFAAQHADDQTKPITLTFALVGLYLHVEKGFSGKEVQRAHMQLAREKRAWPPLALPRRRGSITVDDVMAAPAGPMRDRAIHEWCVSVWDAFAGNRDVVASLLRERHIL